MSTGCKIYIIVNDGTFMVFVDVGYLNLFSCGARPGGSVLKMAGGKKVHDCYILDQTMAFVPKANICLSGLFSKHQGWKRC